MFPRAEFAAIRPELTKRQDEAGYDEQIDRAKQNAEAPALSVEGGADGELRQHAHDAAHRAR